ALGHALDAPPELDLATGDVGPDEKRDVLAAIAQRRHLNGENTEAEVEILAEGAAGHALGEVPVGCGHDSHVHPSGPGRSHPLKLPVLEEPEQLDLEIGGELADLVQEEGAPVGQ